MSTITPQAVRYVPATVIIMKSATAEKAEPLEISIADTSLLALCDLDQAAGSDLTMETFFLYGEWAEHHAKLADTDMDAFRALCQQYVDQGCEITVICDDRTANDRVDAAMKADQWADNAYCRRGCGRLECDDPYCTP